METFADAAPIHAFLKPSGVPRINPQAEAADEPRRQANWRRDRN